MNTSPVNVKRDLRDTPGEGGCDAALVRSLMIVAGEASGDQHAAAVLREFKNRCPELKAIGMGGSRLAEAGLELVVDAEKSAGVMGFTEVIGSLGRIYQAYRALIAAAEQSRPQAAILVDFPDFNFFIARALHRRGIPVVYFISPQLWAWRRGRVRTIRKYVKKVLTIFPFEEHFYHRHGVDARYVGHPFLDRPELAGELSPSDRRSILESYGLLPDLPVVALLPGSRKAEVESLLPEMARAAEIVAKMRPGVQTIIPIAHTLDADWVRARLGKHGGNAVLVETGAAKVLSAADVAVVASGTATVEAALSGVPFVVVYKLSKITYFIGKRLVRGVKFIAMANLIAGKKVVEELIQHDATAERIAEELERIIGDPAKAQRMKQELASVRKKLSVGIDPARTMSQRVVDSVIELFSDAGRPQAFPRRAASAGARARSKRAD